MPGRRSWTVREAGSSRKRCAVTWRSLPKSRRPPAGVRRHLEDSGAVRQERFQERRAAALPPPQLYGAHDTLRTFGPNRGLLTGRRVSTGTVRGLTILVEFQDVESPEKMTLDARGMRTDYLDAVKEFQETYRRECSKANIDYVAIDTSVNFDKALMEYLVQRQRRF